MGAVRRRSMCVLQRYFEQYVSGYVAGLSSRKFCRCSGYLTDHIEIV